MTPGSNEDELVPYCIEGKGVAVQQLKAGQVQGME